MMDAFRFGRIFNRIKTCIFNMKVKGGEESLRPPGKEQLRERGTVQDGVHGMRRELLQPTVKIGGILWRPYVPCGTKKLGNR